MKKDRISYSIATYCHYVSLCTACHFFFGRFGYMLPVPTFPLYSLNLNHPDVSENGGTPKSSILIGFSIINHPFWCTSIFGNTHPFNESSQKIPACASCDLTLALFFGVLHRIVHKNSCDFVKPPGFTKV